MREGMSFEQAVQLAQAIRARHGWHVLEVGVLSGSKLEDDRFSVQALCTLNWRYFHYFASPAAIDEWPGYASAFEEGMRRRESSHEL